MNPSLIKVSNKTHYCFTKSHLSLPQILLSGSLQCDRLLRQLLVDGAVEPEEKSEGNDENEDEVEPHDIDLIKVMICQPLEKFRQCQGSKIIKIEIMKMNLNSKI